MHSGHIITIEIEQQRLKRRIGGRVGLRQRQAGTMRRLQPHLDQLIAAIRLVMRVDDFKPEKRVERSRTLNTGYVQRRHHIAQWRSGSDGTKEAGGIAGVKRSGDARTAKK